MTFAQVALELSVTVTTAPFARVATTPKLEPAPLRKLSEEVVVPVKTVEVVEAGVFVGVVVPVEAANFKNCLLQ